MLPVNTTMEDSKVPVPRAAPCGTCGRPVTGDNRYEAPGGQVQCRYCLNRNNALFKARNRAARLAKTAKRTRAPRDRFAALTAAIRLELIGLDEAQRLPYYQTSRRPVTQGRLLTEAERKAGVFARSRVTREQAGELTGLGAHGWNSTLAQHVRKARREYAAGTATGATMPPPAADGTWRVGALALWRAAVWPQYSTGNPGRWIGDDQALPAIAQAVAEHGRAAGGQVLREAITGELTGPRANVSAARVNRLAAETGLRDVHPGTPAGPDPAALESLRWDGLLTISEVAAAYECGPGAVRAAVKRGEITVIREGRRVYVDPDRLAARRDGSPAPVDIGHKLAVPATRPVPPKR